jgi:thymidylate kinase
MGAVPVVEFAGLPGSGKTTIARAALAELEDMGLRCFCNESLVDRSSVQRRKSAHATGKLTTLARLLLSCARSGRVAFDLARCIAHTRSRNRSSLTRAASLMVLLDEIKSVPADCYDLVLLDQGLLQYVWSIFVAGDLPPDRHLQRLVATVLEEVPLAVIFVGIDATSAASRIGGRVTRSSRFDEFSPAQVYEFLGRYGVVFERIQLWTGELSGTASLVIDGSRPVDHNVRRIVPFIAGLPQAGRMARVTT